MYIYTSPVIPQLNKEIYTMKIDYQNNDYDFLRSFWGIKEAFPIIEKAVQNGVFSALAENRPQEEIKSLLSSNPTEAELLLDILEQAGLLFRGRDYLCATPVSERYLTDSAFLTNQKHKDFISERLHAFLPQNIPYILCPSLSEAQRDIEIQKSDAIFIFCGCYREDHTLSAAVESYFIWQQDEKDRRFSFDEVASLCTRKGLAHTALISVTDSISAVFAAKKETILQELKLTKKQQLIASLKGIGFASVSQIKPQNIVCASWVKDHCRFGCSSFGTKHCPPHSPDFKKTTTRLNEYHHALLIEGVPPTRDFQKQMLKAERIAFKLGFYRAFAYWAGPCSLCTECNPPTPPKKCTATRPSMESAGIDVFATVRKQGFSLETRKNKSEYIKYFGLLLLD